MQPGGTAGNDDRGWVQGHDIVLDAKNLAKHYPVSLGLLKPKATVRALDGVTFNLHGGKRQRIAIARALMLHPRIVVADEPVSALDVSIQAQVLNLLMDLQEETQVAYVFISHNLAVVELIADDVLVMYLGKVVERASKRELFAMPRHPYTRALLASTPRIDKAARQTRQVLTGELPSPLNPPPGCAFHKRCPHAVERCKVEVPLLRQPSDGQTVGVMAFHLPEQ